MKERKGAIKSLLKLNEEQREGKQVILNNPITVITGKTGTGKTLLASQVCLELLFDKVCDKVYITRPTVVLGSELGFLPGELQKKLNPYIEPFIDNLYQCSDKAKVDKLIQETKIEGFAIQFTRGKTIKNGQILVIDEAQNTSRHEMLGLLTRVGAGGKIIVLGDNAQLDTRESYTGLSYAIELAKKIDGIEWVKLHENHRDDIVAKILEYEYSRVSAPQENIV